MNRFIIPDLRVKIIPLLIPETLKHFQVTFSIHRNYGYVTYIWIKFSEREPPQ